MSATQAPLPSRESEAIPRLTAAAWGLLYFAVTLAIIVAVWQGCIATFHLPPFLIPTPLSVAESLVTDWPKLGGALLYTLESTVLGLLCALALALVLAALLSLSERVSQALLPVIITIRTAPVLAIAPLLILMFGRGQATSIVVVVIVSFFPMMVNAVRGFRSPKANALELMHVCGASWWQTFWKVRLPFAVPYIFTGMRTAAAGALLSAMLAEWLSGAPGIGTLILEASSFRKLPLMWAGVVLSMSVAALIFMTTVRLERRLVK